MIKDYLCEFRLYFDEEKRLSSVGVKFNMHDFITRNGGYPENYDYMAWMDFCKKVENDMKEYVTRLSDKVEISSGYHIAYVVKIGDLIYTVSHGREYETGIYLYIQTVESYENEFGRFK
jgi:hypothetical protein